MAYLRRRGITRPPTSARQDRLIYPPDRVMAMGPEAQTPVSWRAPDSATVRSLIAAALACIPKPDRAKRPTDPILPSKSPSSPNPITQMRDGSRRLTEKFASKCCLDPTGESTWYECCKGWATD